MQLDTVMDLPEQSASGDVDEFFIARPPDDVSCPFWLGQVKQITTVNFRRVARMRWFILKEKMETVLRGYMSQR